MNDHIRVTLGSSPDATINADLAGLANGLIGSFIMKSVEAAFRARGVEVLSHVPLYVDIGDPGPSTFAWVFTLRRKEPNATWEPGAPDSPPVTRAFIRDNIPGIFRFTSRIEVATLTERDLAIDITGGQQLWVKFEL